MPYIGTQSVLILSEMADHRIVWERGKNRPREIIPVICTAEWGQITTMPCLADSLRSVRESENRLDRVNHGEHDSGLGYRLRRCVSVTLRSPTLTPG